MAMNQQQLLEVFKPGNRKVTGHHSLSNEEKHVKHKGGKKPVHSFYTMQLLRAQILKKVYLHALLTTYPNAHISHLNHAHIIGSITLNDTIFLASFISSSQDLFSK